jgi:hypothetical protein
MAVTRAEKQEALTALEAEFKRIGKRDPARFTAG